MRVATAADLGLLVRSRRQELGWSQQHVADLARVSRSWLVEFESGKPSAELDLVLRAVQAVRLALDIVLDEHAGALPPVVGSFEGAVDLDDLLASHDVDDARDA